ncbi:MAG: hypothetical protein QOE93_1187, partial [Actinomycetota bacterium]|nr:hypothetical protein [Actinomycetota bacterium]
MPSDAPPAAMVSDGADPTGILPVVDLPPGAPYDGRAPESARPVAPGPGDSDPGVSDPAPRPSRSLAARATAARTAASATLAARVTAGRTARPAREAGGPPTTPIPRTPPSPRPARP